MLICIINTQYICYICIYIAHILHNMYTYVYVCMYIYIYIFIFIFILHIAHL